MLRNFLNKAGQGILYVYRVLREEHEERVAYYERYRSSHLYELFDKYSDWQRKVAIRVVLEERGDWPPPKRPSDP